VLPRIRQPRDEADDMRIIPIAALLMLAATPAPAQVVHPGEVERWFLAIAPLQEARGCITEQDPLRAGLESLLRDTQARAARAIRSDYEKGMLAGRLYGLTVAEAASDAEACERILARVARGLLRLHVP
jgi:hypothetical protein